MKVLSNLPALDALYICLKGQEGGGLKGGGGKGGDIKAGGAVIHKTDSKKFQGGGKTDGKIFVYGIITDSKIIFPGILVQTDISLFRSLPAMIESIVFESFRKKLHLT